MNKHIEIEYKILLTKEIFHKILESYSHDDGYSQTNYYFSHPSFQQKRYMLRIRKKNNTYELTLKRPYQGEKLEINVPLTKKEKDAFMHHENISNEIIDFLKSENIFIEDLQQDFSLTTYRYDIPLVEGILSLDINTYLNQKDYELEFEVYDKIEGYQKFLEIIKPFHLQYTHNCLSKVARARHAFLAKNKS